MSTKQSLNNLWNKLSDKQAQELSGGTTKDYHVYNVKAGKKMPDGAQKPLKHNNKNVGRHGHPLQSCYYSGHEWVCDKY